jgi:hypothetical protein
MFKIIIISIIGLFYSYSRTPSNAYISYISFDKVSYLIMGVVHKDIHLIKHDCDFFKTLNR